MIKVKTSDIRKQELFIAALQDGTLVPFCGAGMSILCPTHLPLAWDLKKNILHNYCSGDDTLEHVFMSFSSITDSDWNLARLPLEYMLEASYAEGLRDFESIMSFMGTSEPNWLHQTIADLSNKGICNEIITTNFDICIEKSCSSIANSVIHLHGSISDPNSLILTIGGIGRGLPNHIADSLRELHRNKILLFLGYSGYDSDILDVLESVNGKPIYWLSLDDNMLGVSSRAKDLIKKVSGVAIIGDITELLYEIRRLAYLETNCNIKCSCNPNWSQVIERSVGKLPIGDRARYVARICLEANDLDNAITAYNIALNNTRNYTIKAKILVNLSFVYYMKRDIASLRELAYKAKQYGLMGKNATFVAHAYNNIGISYLYQQEPDPLLALTYFLKAALIHEQLVLNGFKKMQNLRGAAQSYNNIGLAHMKVNNYINAKNAFQKSIKLKEELGDLIGKAISSLSLAQLECEHNDLEHGLKRHFDSIRTLQEFSKLVSIGYFKGELGKFFYSSGNLKDAENFLKEAVAIYKSVDGPKEELLELSKMLTKIREMS